MSPLEAELALSYCRQARESIARVAGIIPLAGATEPEITNVIAIDRLERALFYLAELERRIKRCAQQGQR